NYAMLKLYSWNVNGIRAAEKKGFLDWLRASDGDVIAVQETKAHPDQLSKNLLAPDGYSAGFVWAEKKGYSGVGTFSRAQPVSSQAGFNDKRFDHEGRVLISDFGRFVFYNIYFPNGGRGPEWVTHKLAFYRKFLELVAQNTQAGRSVIACGDVNTSFAEIDLARPKENANHSGFMPEERAALGEFFSAGLIDTYRMLWPDKVQYSWWDQVTRARERNVGWRLDYFFVSPDLRGSVVAAEIHDQVMGSDHCPISLTLSIAN
ncbi:MAG: exodeoxyribonuclease III, partial [Anaerolineae bacterium]